MTNTTKMTQKQALTIALEVLAKSSEHTEVCEKLKDMIYQLDKKASYKRSEPSKAQKEAEALKEKLYSLMEDEGVYTVSQLMTMLSDAEGGATFSSQKVTSLLSKLKKEFRVDSKKEKGKSFYFVTK